MQYCSRLLVNEIEISVINKRKTLGFAAVFLDCRLAIIIINRKNRVPQKRQHKGNVHQIRKDAEGTV